MTTVDLASGPGGWLALAASAVVVAAAVPVLGPVADRFGLASRPGPLNPEPGPVPLSGGAAIGLGAALAVAPAAPALFGVLVLAWALGTADDRWGVPATVRVAAWAALGAVAGVSVGGTLVAGAVWGVVAGVGINLLDGRDALATSVTTVALVGLALLAADGGPARLVPALLAFLVWNVPPARAYLGNAGASLLGIALAAGAVQATGSVGAVPVMVAMGLLIAEVVATTVRRARAGRGMIRRERGHGYDRLVARGWPVGAVAATYAGIQAALAAAAVVFARSSGTTVALALLGATAVLGALVWGTGALEPDTDGYEEVR